MSDAWDGRPQNPEIERDHLIVERIGGQRFTRAWHWDGERYSRCKGNYAPLVRSAHDMGLLSEEYLGPCLLPEEITAREAASAEAMREQIIFELSLSFADTKSVRALPLPHPDALSRALAAAEKRGMERAIEGMREEAAHLKADARDGFRNGTLPGAYEAAAEWIEWAAREVEKAMQEEAIRNAAAQESEK